MVTISERNKELQSQVPSEDIPHGTDMPFAVMDLYLRSLGDNRLQVLDIGCGSGAMAIQFVNHGYDVIAMDINPQAVTHAKAIGVLRAVVADATTFQIEGTTDDKLFPDNFSGVILKATLCNLPGTGWQDALTHSSQVLLPGGFLFLSETLRAHEYNPDLEIATGGASGYYQHLIHWSHRYAANTACGLPYATIAVARPGHEKRHMEYGTPLEVETLINSDHLERYVSHFSLIELCDYLASLGMTNMELHRTVWRSRDGMPLNGVWGVWQKN